MDIYTLGIFIIILVSIALQAAGIRKVKVKALKTGLEKISLGVTLLLIAVITVTSAASYWHYVAGLLGMLLMYLAYLKLGVTEEGFSLMNRLYGVLKWSDIKEAQLKEAEGTLTLYIETRGRASRLHFKAEDKPALLELIGGRLAMDAGKDNPSKNRVNRRREDPGIKVNQTRH